MKKPKLGWCSNCRENSTVVRMGKKGSRIEICVNKGCGYVLTLPVLKSNGVTTPPGGIHEEDHSSDYDYHPRHPDNR